MVRDFLNSVVQKKFFVMFFTCVIYILGLCAYFSGKSVLFASLMTGLGLFLIIKNYLSPKLVLFWFFVFFFAFFNASFRLKESDSLYKIAPQNVKITGRIASIPAVNGSKKRFFFDISRVTYNYKTENIKAKTLVNLYSRQDNLLNIGDEYELEGKLRTPYEVTNPSQFDYGKYLRNFGVYTIFYTESKYCTKLKSNLPLKWQALQGLNNIRNDIIKVHSKYLKSPNLELLGGMVFGDDAISTPEGLKKSFQRSGLLHLLAASGMNVALIYGIWFFILAKLRVPFNITVSSGIFIVIFYALMTGLGPSVVRAAIMLVFVLIGKLIDRDAHSVSLLSFVALLMLIYNPAYINDVGFQLSFLVTFGLLVMAPVVFEKTKYLPPWLSGSVFIPVIAQVWVAPIQMYYFNSFSLYSVFANIAILPFVTIVSFGGFISSVLALIKPLANVVCFVFDFCLNPVLNVIVWISDYFASLPHSLVQTIKPSILQIILYYLVVLSLTLLIEIGKNKKVIITISLLILGLIFSFVKFPFTSTKLETIAFDVQNADAFLVKTPQNKYFIIDSGKMAYRGGKTQSQMIVLPYLADNGIKNIEGLIITHFDSDHAGGAVDLIQNLNIKNIYVNSLDDKSKLAKEIYKNAGKKVQLAKNNQVIYKENKLIIKNFISGLKGEKLENENSIVTLISEGNFDELFMGDAGVITFNRIKNNLPTKVEILKVGHHGAKNVVNKAMLDRVNPDVAIISTGLNNYGHPNGVTLDILKSHKVKVLRTDRQNSLMINESANLYNVYSFFSGKYVLLR